jgi:hypothetical protein
MNNILIGLIPSYIFCIFNFIILLIGFIKTKSNFLLISAILYILAIALTLTNSIYKHYNGMHDIFPLISGKWNSVYFLPYTIFLLLFFLKLKPEKLGLDRHNNPIKQMGEPANVE